MKKLFAFTLAETLIVMSIIGVVAALTIPNMNHSTGEKEKIASLKKIYAELTDAFGRAQATYGPYDEWFNNVDAGPTTTLKIFAERILDFLKADKICGTEKYTGCWSAKNKFRFTEQYFGGVDHYKVLLKSGTSLSFYSNGKVSRITVDIDGPNKGPAWQGKDVFQFVIKDNELIPEGKEYCSDECIISANGKYNDALSKDMYGVMCTNCAITNGNMDYLKVNMNGFICPNGNTIGENEVTSCK